MMESPLSDTKLMEFIRAKLTDFRSYNETVKKSIFEQAKQYRESRNFQQKLLASIVRMGPSPLSW